MDKLKDAEASVWKLLEELRVYLELIGVTVNLAQGFEYKINHYVKAFDWLHAFSMSESLGKLKKVYALRTPEQWAMYKTLGLKGLNEQEHLNVAIRATRIRWKTKKPRMFGPDRKTQNPEDSERSSVQSE